MELGVINAALALAESGELSESIAYLQRLKVGSGPLSALLSLKRNSLLLPLLTRNGECRKAAQLADAMRTATKKWVFMLPASRKRLSALVNDVLESYARLNRDNAQCT